MGGAGPGPSRPSPERPARARLSLPEPPCKRASRIRAGRSGADPVPFGCRVEKRAPLAAERRPSAGVLPRGGPSSAALAPDGRSLAAVSRPRPGCEGASVMDLGKTADIVPRCGGGGLKRGVRGLIRELDSMISVTYRGKSPDSLPSHANGRLMGPCSVTYGNFSIDPLPPFARGGFARRIRSGRPSRSQAAAALRAQAAARWPRGSARKGPPCRCLP